MRFIYSGAMEECIQCSPRRWKICLCCRVYLSFVQTVVKNRDRFYDVELAAVGHRIPNLPSWMNRTASLIQPTASQYNFLQSTLGASPMEHNENKQNFESDNIKLLWAVFLATVTKNCTIEQKNGILHWNEAHKSILTKDLAKIQKQKFRLTLCFLSFLHPLIPMPSCVGHFENIRSVDK